MTHVLHLTARAYAVSARANNVSSSGASHDEPASSPTVNQVQHFLKSQSGLSRSCYCAGRTLSSLPDIDPPATYTYYFHVLALSPAKKDHHISVEGCQRPPSTLGQLSDHATTQFLLFAADVKLFAPRNDDRKFLQKLLEDDK